jgi:hypothetical protein
MTNLTHALSRYYGLAREDGFKAMICRVWRKVVSYGSLQVRSTWWRLRAGQLPSDQEILQRTDGEWTSPADFLEHLCNKMSPAFLFSVGDRQAYVAILRERYRDHVKETVEAANRVCQHRFRFLRESFEFSGEIDWHLDPKSGLSWPREFFEKIGHRLRSGRGLGDSKLPWELNRHQYFVTLGKAYWLTGDEAFAAEFTQQVLSWIRDNPEGMGINWYSALEIGVRLISWGLAFHFFRDSPHFAREGARPFIKSLYRQAKFLHAHLTLDWEVKNNHILGEAAGLIFVASLFPEFGDAREWLERGLRVFQDELSQQTFADGVNREQATAYHRFVVDFLLLIVILSRRGAIPASPGLEETLEKMLKYGMHLSMVDLGVPMIGDADDGRGYILDEGASFWDFREGLAAGAVLFERADFKFVAREFTEGAFWLLGVDGLLAFEGLNSAPAPEPSAFFPDAGVCILRDSWTEAGDMAFFRCGPFGLGGEGFCAHAHCDLLSLTLGIKGRQLLVDSGTFSYHGPWRNYFRLTPAHNTLVMDGAEQAIPLGEFEWGKVPRAECLLHEKNTVVGQVQTASGVCHIRELRREQRRRWKLIDSVLGEGKHSLTWYFHFAPDLSLEQLRGEDQVEVCVGGSPICVLTVPRDLRIEIGSGWYSGGYGSRIPNPQLVARWEGEIPPTGLRYVWTLERAGEARESRR